MRRTAALWVLLLCVVSPIRPLELYMRRAVYLEDPLPTVSTLVHLAPGQEGSAALETRLPFAVLRPTLLPAATIRHVLGPYYQGNLIVAGGRAAVLPPALASRPEADFYRDLLLYLDQVEEEKQSRVEVELIGEPRLVPWDLAASFLSRPVDGALEVSYRTAGGRRGSLLVRLHRFSDAPRDPGLPLHRMVSDREFALRSGDRIRIRFVKGSVTVAIPGRAFRSGYQGDTVPVRPYDSQESFQGLVVGTREVLVELR